MSEQPYPERYVPAAEKNAHGRWYWTVTDTRTGEVVKRSIASREWREVRAEVEPGVGGVEREARMRRTRYEDRPTDPCGANPPDKDPGRSDEVPAAAVALLVRAARQVCAMNDVPPRPAGYGDLLDALRPFGGPS